MTLVKFTGDNGQPVYVDPEKVYAVSRPGTVTVLWIEGDCQVYVTEDPSAVNEVLEAAK